ncbi:hypothetical protein LAZ40_11470 [Cereibacter sphaeroides]|uniref:hypothetical protein n=1 Tax=Cereibacter sphaeroides TaxID=1063 RepID=UPI001F3F0AAA|nr:hypothetical protein [Cereibacter sphaeroides]MCE6959637.1 hypothetical protein [Cereibacter sphaeroides]MCE6974502.1 hypothetical protein [Cereibacter sphaeroides]
MMAALRPAPFDLAEVKAGLAGRHADGGAARFRELVGQGGLSEEALSEIGTRHRARSLLNVVAAILAFGGGLWVILAGSEVMTILGGAALAFFSLVFLTQAIRSDYAAWQVQVRRMDGFEAYLSGRFTAR